MRRLAEILVFGALAIGIHVAMFAQVRPGGAQSSGAGGQALISLAAASEQIETMVESWTAPPETATDVAPARTDPAAVSKNHGALVKMVDAAHPQSEIVAMQVPQAPDVANLDTQPAPPPPAAKPPQPKPKSTTKSAVKPKPKPEPRQTPQNKPKAKPAGKAQAASSGRAAQKAAGSGGGQVAGQKGADKAVSSGQRKSLMAKWGARIRSQVERRKRSPAGGAKGTVVLRLKVARSGHLQSVSVRKSSGHSALDAAAIAAVKRVRKFPAAPKGLTDQSYGFSLPIKFGQ